MAAEDIYPAVEAEERVIAAHGGTHDDRLIAESEPDYPSCLLAFVYRTQASLSEVCRKAGFRVGSDGVDWLDTARYETPSVRTAQLFVEDNSRKTVRGALDIFLTGTPWYPDALEDAMRAASMACRDRLGRDRAGKHLVLAMTSSQAVRTFRAAAQAAYTGFKGSDMSRADWGKVLQKKPWNQSRSTAYRWLKEAEERGLPFNFATFAAIQREMAENQGRKEL